MNPEYLVLAGVLWRLWHKHVGLWYNHASHTLRLRIALRLAHVVFHTSPFSASAGTKKSHLMPAGIDTDVFAPSKDTRRPFSVYYQGRIAPSKRVEVLCEAVKRLRAGGIPATATIIGPEDPSYGKLLHEEFADLVREQSVVFVGPKRNDETPALFSRHAVSVNLASRGGLDKSVLESCACETPALASSDAFGELVPQELRFIEGDAASLAAALKRFFAMPDAAKRSLGEHLRVLTIQRHSLTRLVPLVLAEYPHV
jgi:mannosyltransferase